MQTELTCEEVDDDFDAGPYAMPLLWEEKHQLMPPPPAGWFMMINLPVKPTGLDVGCWICALWALEKEELQRAQILHVIVRDKAGDRWIMIDPILLKWATDLLSDFNARVEGCNCGGSDCLAGEFQYAGLKVLAARAWAKMSYPKRIGMVKNCDYGYEDHGIAITMAGPSIFFATSSETAIEFGIEFLEEIIGAR